MMSRRPSSSQSPSSPLRQRQNSLSFAFIGPRNGGSAGEISELEKETRTRTVPEDYRRTEPLDPYSGDDSSSSAFELYGDAVSSSSGSAISGGGNLRKGLLKPQQQQQQQRHSENWTLRTPIGGGGGGAPQSNRRRLSSRTSSAGNNNKGSDSKRQYFAMEGSTTTAVAANNSEEKPKELPPLSPQLVEDEQQLSNRGRLGTTLFRRKKQSSNNNNTSPGLIATSPRMFGRKNVQDFWNEEEEAFGALAPSPRSRFKSLVRRVPLLTGSSSTSPSSGSDNHTQENRNAQTNQSRWIAAVEQLRRQVSKQEIQDNNSASRTPTSSLIQPQPVSTQKLPWLHELCESAQTVSDLVPAVLHIEAQPDSASELDPEQARTVLHVLSHNHTLAHSLPNSIAAGIRDSLSSETGSLKKTLSVDDHELGEENNDEQILTDFVVGIVWPAYPAAMITMDHDGYIPFERALREWVDESYEGPLEEDDRSLIRRRGRLSLESIHSEASDASVMPSPNTKLTPERSLDVELGGGSRRTWGLRRQLSERHLSRNRLIPSEVSVTALARCSIQLLSVMLDRMEYSLNPRKIQTNLEHVPIRDMRESLIQTVASIPDLLKVVLLIKDKEERNWCLGTTLMRRVLTSKHSVGPWLTGMIQSNSKQVSDYAMEYLEMVSNAPFDELPTGNANQKNRETKKAGADAQDEFYHEVSCLQNFVPSLLSLEEKDIEDAARTEVVRQVLDRIISRPFAVMTVFCDAVFLVLLIAGFRAAVNGLILGKSPGTVLYCVYIENVGLFYFVIREIGKGISLCMIPHGARIYFLSFWNLADLLCTVLSLVSTIAIRYKYVSREADEMEDVSGLRNLIAVTTGFMWLRVLNYLKGINMQLATFVLAILQITRDILWFCVILFVLVISFSQMFYTLLAPKDCSEDTGDRSQQCTQSEYYLGVYAILLGDFGTFERESFTSAFSLLLVVLYTFMVVLVLLNVLIAVASDSYEKCLLRCHRLFGRARVMMIAELVSFQHLLRRNTQSPELMHEGKTWWSNDSWARGWSRGSLLFLSLSSLVVAIWTIGEIVGYSSGPRHGSIWMSLCSVFVTVALFVGIMWFLSTGAFSRSRTPRRSLDFEGSNAKFHGEWYARHFQQTMVHLLGSSGGTTNINGTDHLWRGRLHFLQNEIVRINIETREEYASLINSLEARMGQSESRLRGELATLEKGMGKLQSVVTEGFQLVRSDRQKARSDRDTGTELGEGGVTEILLAIRSLEESLFEITCT